MAAALGAIAAEATFLRRGGYSVGLKTAVRCHDGHLFTTIWIPEASLKAMSVRPVKDSELTDEIQWTARRHHDVSIP